MSRFLTIAKPTPTSALFFVVGSKLAICIQAGLKTLLIVLCSHCRSSLDSDTWRGQLRTTRDSQLRA